MKKTAIAVLVASALIVAAALDFWFSPWHLGEPTARYSGRFCETSSSGCSSSACGSRHPGLCLGKCLFCTSNPSHASGTFRAQSARCSGSSYRLKSVLGGKRTLGERQE